MAWTGVQLRNAALERLGVKALGQTAAAEYASRMDDIWTSLYSQLYAEQLLLFDSDSVADWAQQPLVKILAAEAAPEFGFVGPRLAGILGAGAEGMRELATQARGKRKRIPAKANFF